MDAKESKARLLREINDRDWRVRRNAVAELAQDGDKNAIHAVLRALRDDHGNLNIASSAIQLLASSGVDTLAALVELLADPHAEIRGCAALTLGLQNNVRAIPPLLAKLGDGDVNVRYHVIEALGRLRTAEATEALAAIAETRDFMLAFPALEALAKIEDGRVSHRLLPLLSDALLQSAVIDTLGAVGGKDAIPSLVALLDSPGSPTDVVARNLVLMHNRLKGLAGDGSIVADTTRKLIDANGVQHLLDGFLNADKRSHGSIATVMAWLGSPAVDQMLIKMIDLPEVLDSFVRKGSVVMDLLIEQIGSMDLEVRKASVVALGRIGSTAAVPILLQVLKQDGELPILAAGALAMIGDRRAYGSLLDLLESYDPAIGRAAVSALNSLGHIEMAKDMASRLGHRRPEVRECVVRIVGYAGYADLVDQFLQCCKDEDESVRRAAVESLPCLEDDARIQAVLRLAMADHAGSVRAAAARTLGKFSIATSGALLRESLSDASVWVRYYAARSLARLHDASALGDLLRLAQADPAVQVRVAAVEAIGSLGDLTTVPVLTVLIESSDIDLARAAIAAVGVVGGDAAVLLLSKVIASGDSARQLEAARALGTTYSIDAVAPLVKAASSADGELAAAAIKSLQRLGSRDSVAALIELASAPSLRNACVTALTASDASHVGNGLSHPLLDVRLAVVKSLAQNKDSQALALLAAALDDIEGAVRYAALDALAWTGNPPARNKLADLADGDSDPAVRHSAQGMLQG